VSSFNRSLTEGGRKRWWEEERSNGTKTMGEKGAEHEKV